MGTEEFKQFSAGVKDKVMDKIKKRKVMIQSKSSFVAKELGIESVLVAVLILGALLVSVTMYFLKKTGVLKFINLGLPGLKVIVLALPYDYIILFVLTMIIANYLAKELDFSYRKNIPSRTLTFMFFLASLSAGLFFASIGVNEAVKGWSHNQIPKEMAVSGKIMDFSSGVVVIEEDDGQKTEVTYDKSTFFTNQTDYTKGKVLRATGFRVKKDGKIYFHADQIHCCDDN